MASADRLSTLALDQPELSPRELAVRFTDQEKYCLTVFGLSAFEARDRITSPAYIVIKVAQEFKDKTTGPTSSGRLTSPNLKITGWHCYLPGDLERQVAAFVEHYNHARYHESLGNLAPADVYFARPETILLERVKRQTIANLRLQHHLHAA